MNIQRIVIIFMVVFCFIEQLFAEDQTVVDSYVEFPVVVFVGQIIKITPYSVIFENTYTDTKATTQKIEELMNGYSHSPDVMDHGFAKALKVITVNNGRMRASFYLDNITSVFDDNIQNYMRFLPLYYLLRNNINEMKLSESYIEEFKELSLNYYLNLPMAKEIMENSWFAAVFRISPDSSKLMYQSANYYTSIDELMNDAFAKEYMIPQIVKAGLVMSVAKTKIKGHESVWAKDKIKNSQNDKENKSESKKKGFNNKKYDTSGQSK